ATISQSSSVTSHVLQARMNDARRQRIQRARPVAAMALVAFVIGAIVGAHSGSSSAQSLAGRFVKQWTPGEYPALVAEVDDATRNGMTASQCARVYRDALTRATAKGARVAGHTRSEGEGRFAIPVSVTTSLFETLKLPYEVHVVDSGGSERVAWTRAAAF